MDTDALWRLLKSAAPSSRRSRRSSIPFLIVSVHPDLHLSSLCHSVELDEGHACWSAITSSSPSFSYGYSKYSFFWSPNIFSGRIFGAEPERGDVVVFRKTLAAPTSTTSSG